MTAGFAKILFVDRDGTLIREPHDYQIDAFEKFRLVPGVIPSLLALAAAGYRFVMVTNQDGLGSDTYPQASYDAIQAHLIDVFGSQGITFAEVLVCPHLPADDCECRKPRLGLVRTYLADPDWDRTRSAVVGDRDTDVALGDAMGVRGFKLDDTRGWSKIVRELLATPRRSRVVRATKETRVTVEVALDGDGAAHAKTGIGFFDHMLEQIGKHGGFDLDVTVEGDLEVDDHHTVEDTGLALGEALRRALGDKAGIERFGFLLPMDDAEAQIALDLSGRPYFVMEGSFARPMIGGLATEMVPHFFRSLSEALGANLHVRVRGDNTHHMVESTFKGVGRALRQAIRVSGVGLPSTKGVL
jgi:imidazoleglycerol-phosphate dehydratase/histidinol-phosphatase